MLAISRTCPVIKIESHGSLDHISTYLKLIQSRDARGRFYYYYYSVSILRHIAQRLGEPVYNDLSIN